MDRLQGDVAVPEAARDVDLQVTRGGRDYGRGVNPRPAPGRRTYLGRLAGRGRLDDRREVAHRLDPVLAHGELERERLADRRVIRQLLDRDHGPAAAERREDRNRQQDHPQEPK